MRLKFSSGLLVRAQLHCFDTSLGNELSLLFDRDSEVKVPSEHN